MIMTIKYDLVYPRIFPLFQLKCCGSEMAVDWSESEWERADYNHRISSVPDSCCRDGKMSPVFEPGVCGVQSAWMDGKHPGAWDEVRWGVGGGGWAVGGPVSVDGREAPRGLGRGKVGMCTSRRSLFKTMVSHTMDTAT